MCSSDIRSWPGTLGNRYVDPQPYAFKVKRALSQEGGFEV